MNNPDKYCDVHNSKFEFGDEVNERKYYIEIDIKR